MERDKPNFAAVAMETKKGGFKKVLDSFHQTSCVAAFGGLNKFKMVAVAMVTKVQKMLNSLQASQSFAAMFPVTSTSSGTR